MKILFLLFSFCVCLGVSLATPIDYLDKEQTKYEVKMNVEVAPVVMNHVAISEDVSPGLQFTVDAEISEAKFLIETGVSATEKPNSFIDEGKPSKGHIIYRNPINRLTHKSSA
jgi:hypothetical protein